MLEVYQMPGKQHLNGVGEKEQRQYEHVLQSLIEGGRNGKGAREIAARTVLKHHATKHHRKGE
jgi:hypothetical protein